MAHKFKGEVDIEFGLGLPNLTTAQRTGYTPSREGYKVWDNQIKAEFIWDGSAWLQNAGNADLTTLENRVTVNEGDITTAEGNITQNAADIVTETNARVAADALKVNKAGDTMSGDLVMGGNEITGLPATPSATGAASKEYVDSTVGALTNSLDELTDTTITAAADGDFLRHNGSAWVDAPLIAADIPDISATYGTAAQGALADTAVQPGDATSTLTNNDAFVELAGSTMTGTLVLSGAPTADLHAATKKYVDDQLATGDSLEELTDTTITAAADGDFLRHNGVAWVDHVLVAADITDGAATFATFAQGALADTAVQPGDNISDLTNDSNFVDLPGVAAVHYTKAQLDAGQLDNRYYTETEADANFVDVAGDTMTGELILANSTPSTALAATSKAYVDAAITTGATLAIDDLTDVTITAAATADFLRFNGTAWVDHVLVAADITDGGTVFATFAQGALADSAVQPGDATSTLTNNDAFVDLTTAQTIAGAKTFSDNADFSGDVTVAGDLVVSGTTTTVNSTNTEIADSIITLNKGETGAGVTNPNQSGLEIDRGTEDNKFLIWAESQDKFGQADVDGSGDVDVATFKAFALEEDVNASSYQEVFNTGDWTTGSPNTYVITQATHGIPYTANEVFIVQVYEADGSLVNIDTTVNQTTGDVTLSTAGAIFDGRVIISK